MSTSIVVVNYRTGEVLFTALASLLDQQGVARIVVVDNDNAPSVTDRLQRLVTGHPKFELLSGHGNIGFARACNLGARLIDSEFIMFLNPDCIMAPETIETLCVEARRLTEPFILTPRLINPDGTDQRGARRDVLTPWLALVEWLRLYKLAPNHPYFRRFNQHDAPLPTTTEKINVISGACMFMRRSTFDDLGGFDPLYFLHVEDIDLCVRLLRRGGSAYFCPAVSLVHYGQSSQVSKTFVEWHKSRSFRRYFRKNFVDLYPTGFITLVNFMVTLRFLAMLPILMASDILSKGRSSPKFRQRYRTSS